ncbi:MAG: hypothetical protein J6L62_08230 [Clostridia bacterium]|nr:hypothetical protein [Clostridia bacterium]
MCCIKRFTTIFIALFIFLVLTFQVSAQHINLDEWNNTEKVYLIADNDNESNSGLTNAQLKVSYDYPSHRMRLFFMMKFAPFEEEENIGIRFSLNDGEDISLYLNGDTEYNEDKYFLDFIYMTTPPSGVVFAEVTLGVKEGIPEKQVFTVTFTDPDKTVSNTYSVDVTEAEATLPSQELTTEKEKSSKTKKSTSNGSGSKSKTERTVRTQADQTTSASEETSEAVIRKTEASEEIFTYDGQKVLCISAAVLITVVLFFAGGMYFLKRKNHRGDED